MYNINIALSTYIVVSTTMPTLDVCVIIYIIQYYVRICNYYNRQVLKIPMYNV